MEAIDMAPAPAPASVQAAPTRPPLPGSSPSQQPPPLPPMPANGAVRHGSASSARSVLSAVSSVTFADLECDLDGDGDGHPASSSFSRQKLSQEVVSFCSDGSFVDRGSTIATNDDYEGGSDDGLVNGRLVERKILDEERRGGVEIGMMDGARRRFRSRQTHGEEEVASSHAALSAMVDSRRASLRQCEVSFLDELLREGDDGQKEMARRSLEDGDVFFAEGEASGVKDEGIEGEAWGEAAEDGVDRRAAFLLAERGGPRLSRRSSIWRAHESGLSVTTAGSERSIVGRRRSLTAASGRGLISTAQPVQIGRTASGTRRAAFLDALGREHFLSESSSTLDIVGKGGGDEGGGEDAGVFRRGQEGGSSRIILSTIAGQEWVRGDRSSAAAATATTGARGTNDDGYGKIGGDGVAFEGTSDQSAPVPEIPATQPGAVIRPASLLQSGRSVSVGSTRSVRFARGHSIPVLMKEAGARIRSLGGGGAARTKQRDQAESVAASSTTVPVVIDVRLPRYRPNNFEAKKPPTDPKILAFERLNRHKTESFRRRTFRHGNEGSYAAKPSSPSPRLLHSPRESSDASAISKMTEAEPAYERLYRNKKQPRRFTRNVDDRSGTGSVTPDDFSAAQARVERRLAYKPVRLGKQLQRIESSRLERLKSASFSTPPREGNSVFERLYLNSARLQKPLPRKQESRLKAKINRLEGEPAAASPFTPRTMDTSGAKEESIDLSACQEDFIETDSFASFLSDSFDDSSVRIEQLAKAGKEHISKRDMTMQSFFEKDSTDWYPLESPLGELNFFPDSLVQTPRKNEDVLTEAAAVIIQSAYRSHRCKETYARFKTLAVAIQARTRGFLTRRILISTVMTALKVRRHWRRLRADPNQQISSIVIRSAYKLLQCASSHANLKKLRVTFNGTTRGLMAICRLYAYDIAALTIQRTWRQQRVKEGKKNRNAKYRRKQGKRNNEERPPSKTFLLRHECLDQAKTTKKSPAAAVAIQALYRGYQCAAAYSDMRTACVCLQARTRGVVARGRVRSLEGAALVLQRHWRRKQRHATEAAAAVAIQALYRGYQCAAAYSHMRTACVCLQARTRGVVARGRVRSLEGAALVLQRHWRRKQRYATEAAAAVAIQALYRGYQCAAAYSDMRTACVCLQARTRGVVARGRVRSLEGAALVLQRHWRRKQRHATEAAAAVAIQALYRGYQCAAAYSDMRTACVCLQARTRGVVARGRVRSLEGAALVLQRHWRRKQRHATEAAAAVAIQALYRGYQCAAAYSDMRTACVCLQARTRGVVARGRVRSLEGAALVLQRHWRRKQRHATEAAAAVAIQALYRGYQCAAAYSDMRTACVCLQARTRGVVARGRVRSLEGAALVLQRHWRRKQRHATEAAAAVAIQALYRGYQCAAAYSHMRTACVCLQARTRGVVARGRVRSLEGAALVLQRHWRRKQRHATEAAAAVAIQALYRGYQCAAAYSDMRTACVCLQARTRGVVARGRVRSLEGAALVLQRHWRRKQRHATEAAAAVAIQALYRGYQCAAAYSHMRTACVCLQARTRGVVARGRVRSLEGAALVLQRHWRRKQRYATEAAAAVAIQALYRGYQCAAAYSHMRTACVCLQARTRGVVARGRVRSLEGAALVLQRHWRRKQRHATEAAAAVAIQALYRGYQCAAAYSDMRTACVCLQARTRGVVARGRVRSLEGAALVLQRHWRRKQRHATEAAAAVAIQALYRGYQCAAALMVSELSASNVSNGQSVQSNMTIEEFTTPGVFRRTLSDDNYDLDFEDEVLGSEGDEEEWDLHSEPDKHDAWNVLHDEYAFGYSTIPFQILGTSADDVDSHPHVLSPPLMEGLQSFFPYTVSEDNFWMKFSLARDGASLHTLLQSVRGAKHTVIAIETVEGEVFGSFTSAPWRKNWNYFGSGEAFLWRMRRDRNAQCNSVIDQAQLETELDVFPWTGENDFVQLATSNKIAIGGGSEEENCSRSSSGDGGFEKMIGASSFDKENSEALRAQSTSWDMNGLPPFGFGLAIDKCLLKGTSNPCLTFGSPALSHKHADSSPFEILNLEVWTLTPCTTLEDAEKLELSKLFLESSRPNL